jgi:signal transduction histidine kinase
MTNPLTGIRGRVTFTVLAVSAVLFSALGTVGFVQMASSGRAAIRERINHVLDDLERNVRGGNGTVTIAMPDGVTAEVVTASSDVPTVAAEVRVERAIEVRGTPVLLVGRSSQARLTDSLRSLFRGLWIAVPLAAIASALMAGAATRRALRPVGAITDLAATIGGSTSSAAARVPVPPTGDEIQHLAEAVNEMLARIERAGTAQRQFTSDAAHELRTPLMALQGELELLGGKPERVDGPLLERLGHLGHRLGDRIDDLVLLSTLDEGRTIDPAPVSLLALVREEAATTPGHVSGDDVTVSLDRRLVARAVRNLLANAHRHARSRVNVTVVQDGDRAWVHVDDDGPGIETTDRGAVFDRFTRLDDARAADTGGSGLGLAIVASVAAAHHGGVSAAASALGGARVSLWLPT